MKKLLAILITVIMVVGVVATLAACKSDNVIDIWVGSESEVFYQGIADEYIQQYNAAHPDEPFPYEIKVSGGDISGYAATVLNDAEAGPDIFSIPHDNIGKLMGDNPILSAITDQSLITQIEADNPDGFKEVIKADVGGTTHYVGVPYIGQSLVLYYDKTVLSEDDVKTWEGIAAKAEELSTSTHPVKATFPMGNDCYNLSLFTLARKIDSRNPDDGTLETSTAVHIYEGATANDRARNVVFATDQEVAVYKWAQRFFKNDHGMTLAPDDSITVSLAKGNNECGNYLTLVGGAWKYKDVQNAFGDNTAIAELPEFTITEADAYGTITEGTQFKSGTFADCKILCINGFASEDHAPYLQDIMKYMSSKEVQERSFEECNNLPTYKNAATEFEAMTPGADATAQQIIAAQLAQVQTSMMRYGIPQPFGFHTLLNNRFYSSGADAIIQDILLQRDSANNGAAAYNTDESLLAGLTRVQNLWLGKS